MTDEYALGHGAIAEFVGTFSSILFGAGAVASELLTVPERFASGPFIDGGGLGHGALGADEHPTD